MNTHPFISFQPPLKLVEARDHGFWGHVYVQMHPYAGRAFLYVHIRGDVHGNNMVVWKLLYPRFEGGDHLRASD